MIAPEMKGVAHITPTARSVLVRPRLAFEWH
jgi:hypothetical protein